MVSTASSQQNRRADRRRQDRLIAGFWMPFSLLFHLWVYLTPTYEEKWDLVQPLRSRSQSHPPLTSSLVVAALMVISVLGFALFALLTLPPITARLLLILAFGFSFRQYMRLKT